MRRQGRDDLVEAVAGGVVEQDAHAHTTVGRLEHFLHQHPRADAVVDDVVLQIEADLGMANQFGPRGKRLATVGEQAKPRLPFVGRGLSLNRTAEAGVRRWQCLAWFARHIEAGAAAEERGEYQ